MADHRFDLIVLGGGPGGYVAAIRAAQLGMKTALVEREHLGGVCLNWGCIPTKALLRSAEVFALMREAKAFGLTVDNPSFDLRALVQRSRRVAAQLNRGVAHLLKKNKVTVFEGHGRVAGRQRLAVQTAAGEQVLEAPHIILATGARARELPGFKADGKLVWTYREAMVPERLPASVLVVGSGAIGMEFASFYRSLGSEVTVVEVLDRVLPLEDAEISAFVHKAFERRGIRIHTRTTVKGLARGHDRVEITLEETGGRSWPLTVERVILAVGIVGNVEDIGLEHTKVRVDKSHVITDPFGRTDEPGIYAIGDLAGPPWLAHKASHEGVVCVETIAGVAGVQPLDATKIPGCTYCHPQVASVGLTEQAARDKGLAVRIGRFPLIGNGKAIALGDAEGLIKTVFDANTGELLGAHMVGPEVTEMIQGFVIARQLEATEHDLMHTIFPHPTISEAMHEAVLDAYGRAIHI